MNEFTVFETKKAIKSLKKLPNHIKNAYSYWRHLIEEEGGMDTVKETKSYNFEMLKGKRKGQHSCRLSNSYRIIFEVIEKEIVIKVLEVNKHKY